MSKNISDLTGKKGLDDNLFDALGRLARPAGAPAITDMERLADEFLIGKANVYGSASFYDFTRDSNKGKAVYVCNGTACITAGTQKYVHEQLLNHFDEAQIGDMCCLGRCYENSAFHYQDHNYSGSDIKELAQLIQHPKPLKDQYHVGYYGTPLLTTQPDSLPEWTELLMHALAQSPDALLQAIDISGLRGRGGAGFPMSIKLQSCQQTEGQQKFVVCNADEGDPGAFSDKYLLEHQPYSVLFGMMLTGYIIGAQWGVVYIRGEYPESVQIINDCVAQLHEQHLLGDAIRGTHFNFRFKVIKAQGAYICGEETALLNSIEGQRPEVRVRPPYPAQQGLFNKPTVVQNVETLACVPWIVRHGGDAFAALGRGRSTGTKLVCLDGHFNRPGVYEVEMGTPLEVVVESLGNGFKEDIKALQIGGPLGGIVPLEKIKQLTVDFESFQEQGFLLGHASVVCIPSQYPMIDFLQHLFAFTAHESCGKCFPCRLGATRGRELIQKAQERDFKIDRQLMDDLLETMQIGSLCALGGGVPLPVKNALLYFEDELRPYFQ